MDVQMDIDECIAIAEAEECDDCPDPALCLAEDTCMAHVEIPPEVAFDDCT